MEIAVTIALVIIFMGFTAFTGAPYVPSMPTDIRKCFKNLYPLSSKDLLIDLGAGDGIVMKIASGEYKAKTFGIELNPLLAFITWFRLRKINKHKKLATIKCRNFFKTDFPKETTVVYVFGETRDIEKIFKKISNEAKRLKKDLYVISYGFQTSKYHLEKQSGAYFLYKVGK